MCVQCPNKVDAQKSLATLAVTGFTIPGDSGFPLNAFLSKPASRAEAGETTLIMFFCLQTVLSKVLKSAFTTVFAQFT